MPVGGVRRRWEALYGGAFERLGFRCRRPPQRGTQLFDDIEHGVGVPADGSQHEFVRVYGNDVMSSQFVRRKVLQVEGHDGRQLGMNRCGQDVPVVGVGQG